MKLKSSLLLILILLRKKLSRSILLFITQSFKYPVLRVCRFYFAWLFFSKKFLPPREELSWYDNYLLKQLLRSLILWHRILIWYFHFVETVENCSELTWLKLFTDTQLQTEQTTKNIKIAESLVPYHSL